MTRQYAGMGSVSDWLKQISRAARTIRNTTHTWVLTRHQYGISALVSQTSFRGKTSGRVAECLLFSQARLLLEIHIPLVSCNKCSFFLSLSDHCIFPLLIFLGVERLVLWLSTDVKSKFLNTVDWLPQCALVCPLVYC